MWFGSLPPPRGDVQKKGLSPTPSSPPSVSPSFSLNTLSLYLSLSSLPHRASPLCFSSPAHLLPVALAPLPAPTHPLRPLAGSLCLSLPPSSGSGAAALPHSDIALAMGGIAVAASVHDWSSAPVQPVMRHVSTYSSGLSFRSLPGPSYAEIEKVRSSAVRRCRDMLHRTMPLQLKHHFPTHRCAIIT